MTKRYRDDDIDDRPRRRSTRTGPKKSKKKGGPSVGLIVGLTIGGIVLLGGGAVGAVLLLRDRSTGSGAGSDQFPNMIAHWSFDDFQTDKATEVTTVRDSTGRGNNGKLVGGRLAPGKKGNALWLDGRDDQYLDISVGKDLNFADGAEFTVAAWYQTSERFGTILAYRGNDLKNQLDLYVRTNHLLGIVGDDRDPGPNHAFIWCDPKNDGQWHHAALTRKGKVIELYYDGMSVGKDMTGNCAGPITGDMRMIGCNLKFVEDDEKLFGRRGFKGAIDEVYMFSRALTAPEIGMLMKR
jgi:Concanavalin A-like lectin/glucanases superfamily